MKYIILDGIDGSIHRWSIPSILREINRDRSSEWTPYNKEDWKEGLEEFTEHKLIGIVS